MRMELIQPFINAADAVLAETLQCSTRIVDVDMGEEAYRRKGDAAIISIQGDIEGRVVFDLDNETAVAIAAALSGCSAEEAATLVQETVFELANLVIGNAVTTLNDEGYRFKINPPQSHTDNEGMHTTEDTEALVMCFEVPSGKVYMNIAMRHNRRRKAERAGALA